MRLKPMGKPLHLLRLSTRAHNGLRRGGIHSIEEAARLSLEDLQRFKGIGVWTAIEITTAIKSWQQANTQHSTHDSFYFNLPMTSLPASFQGDDNLDFDSIFERWWASEVHPTVKPSLHSRTTHTEFARAVVKMLMERTASEG